MELHNINKLSNSEKFIYLRSIYKYPERIDKIISEFRSFNKVRQEVIKLLAPFYLNTSNKWVEPLSDPEYKEKIKLLIYEFPTYNWESTVIHLMARGIPLDMSRVQLNSFGSIIVEFLSITKGIIQFSLGEDPFHIVDFYLFYGPIISVPWFPFSGLKFDCIEDPLEKIIYSLCLVRQEKRCKDSPLLKSLKKEFLQLEVPEIAEYYFNQPSNTEEDLKGIRDIFFRRGYKTGISIFLLASASKNKKNWVKYNDDLTLAIRSIINGMDEKTKSKDILFLYKLAEENFNNRTISPFIPKELLISALYAPLLSQ